MQKERNFPLAAPMLPTITQITESDQSPGLKRNRLHLDSYEDGGLSNLSLNQAYIRSESFCRKKELIVDESRLKSLRDLKLFPIFGDEEIAKFSINYFLYLEFFHMGIRIFFALFI